MMKNNRNAPEMFSTAAAWLSKSSLLLEEKSQDLFFPHYAAQLDHKLLIISKRSLHPKPVASYYGQTTDLNLKTSQVFALQLNQWSMKTHGPLVETDSFIKGPSEM